MKNTFNFTLIIGLLLTVFILGSGFIYGQESVNSNQSEDNGTQLRRKLAEHAALIRKKIEENGDPIADFVLPELMDAKQQSSS